MRQTIELYFSVILQKNRDCAKCMSGEAALAGSSSRYLKSDEDEGSTLVYANNPECFSEEFLTFMGLDAVLAMKAEAQKQETPKKEERTQKQEGAPKQEGTQKHKSPKKQKLLAQSLKVKGWMEEDESPRDAAYLDQAPEFPSCTYSVGFKTVKNPGGQVVRARLPVSVTFRLQ